MIPKEIRPELWSYMAGICRNQKILPIAINGFDDHAHLLFHLPASMALATAVSMIKSNSCAWMRERQRRFEWQEGYGAFSISNASTADVAEYIHNQEIHHARISFVDEYRALLREHGVV